jgi:alpha-L-rhamnosidase
MKPDGTPITDDTSLMHGWSTWPVYLLPRYLGGVEPLQPGWIRWKAKPVLADLNWVNLELSTPVGKIGLTLRMSVNTGEVILRVPVGSTAEVFPPEGWIIVMSKEISVASQTITGQEAEVVVRICKGYGEPPTTGFGKTMVKHEEVIPVMLSQKVVC